MYKISKPLSSSGRYRYLADRGQQLVKLSINSVPLSTLTVLQAILHPLQGPLPLLGQHCPPSGSAPGPINSITPLTAKCNERHKLATHYPTTVSGDSSKHSN